MKELVPTHTPARDSGTTAPHPEPSPRAPLHPILQLHRSIGNQAVGRMLQRSASPGDGAGGQPIDPPLRQRMESAFGEGFGDVRVHTGGDAAGAAAALGARAFTRGTDITFGSGHYAPNRLSGQMLLAHELAHVAQQRRARSDTPSPGGAAEHEAQHAAFDAVAGRRASVRTSGAPVQTSLLSDAVAKAYATSKGDMFDVLRSHSPGSSGDADLVTWIGTNLKGDDLWLAFNILYSGPEPLWSDALLTERHKRATDPQHPWDPEPGNIEATIGMSSGLVKGATSVPIKAYFFPGQTNERALIIGGIHGSELSGVEAAERVAQTLVDRFKTSKTMPKFTTIIVPQVFPDSVALAKSKPSKEPSAAKKKDPKVKDDPDSNVGRELVIPKSSGKGTKTLFPARMFPEPGKGLSDLQKAGGPVDSTGARLTDSEGKPVPLLPEIEALMKLIERFKPSRIASIHAHRFNALSWGTDAPGIFVDPRLAPGEKVDPRHKLAPMASGVSSDHAADDTMTLDLAKEAKRLGAHVPGNWIGSSKGEVVHYAASAGHPKGFSLGDWGPSVGITVVTVEVEHYYDSAGGTRSDRAKELQAHAEALVNKFLQ